VSTGPGLESSEQERAGGARPLAPAAAHGSTKSGAARLSIASNTLLIVLKVVAGVITGSIAILT
jgi:hypothetical protein